MTTPPPPPIRIIFKSHEQKIQIICFLYIHENFTQISSCKYRIKLFIFLHLSDNFIFDNTKNVAPL
jgi:hypothetical protein